MKVERSGVPCICAETSKSGRAVKGAFTYMNDKAVQVMGCIMLQILLCEQLRLIQKFQLDFARTQV